MNRRQPTGDHPKVNHERWLISYADFITLLFAFFVVMYAASRGDVRKVHQLAAAIQSAFAQLGIFSPASEHLQLTQEPMPPVAPMGPLVALQQKLQSELAQEIAKREVSLDMTRQGLIIRLQEAGFFDSGSDRLRPGALPVLARIAAAVAPLPNAVRIEGHTDNVPIHNARFGSNWELSTARATELVRLFIGAYQVAPERLAAAGYADYHPIASNATLAGRQLNRRVDVVVVAAGLLVPPGAPGAAGDAPPAAPAHPGGP